MQLCETCRESRDWDNDPLVAWHIQQNMAKPDTNPSKARCRECTRLGDPPAPTFIRNPLFQICRACAVRLDACQHCRGPMPAEAHFQQLLDLFTASRKMFGITRTIELFGLQRDELGPEAVDRVLAADADKLENDPERRKRKIWTLVYGQLRFGTPPPRCDGCAPIRTPRYCRASECGHWTVGLAARWCFPCAVEAGQCATCSIPTREPEASPE